MRSLGDAQAPGGKLLLRRLITVFPTVLKEKTMGPDSSVQEASMMQLNGLSPGAWQLRDVGSNNLPGGWGPSFSTGIFRVQYQLVMRAAQQGDEPDPSLDAAVDVWLTNNPALLAAAHQEASVAAAAAVGAAKDAALAPGL
jgi:hypothetical protein